MPAAIPLAIAGATMVAQNVQNKAAIKNNENQQTAAVNNAKQSADAAFQRQSQWLQSNPAPYANGFNIARPPTATISGGAPQAPSFGSTVQNIMQGAMRNNMAPSPGFSGGFNPQQLIQQIIRQHMGGYPPPQPGMVNTQPQTFYPRDSQGFGGGLLGSDRPPAQVLY